MLFNCDGEDGANGLGGINGENGEGFDELVKYGNITVNLKGKRPDGENFTDEADFRFIGLSAPSVNIVVKNTTSLKFTVARFLSAPSVEYQESYGAIVLTVNDPGKATQNFDFDFKLNKYSIISDDNKFFTIAREFLNNETGVTNVIISDYAFNEVTNNLSFSYSFEVAANINETGNDLSISGAVDVIVLESITPPAP